MDKYFEYDLDNQWKPIAPVVNTEPFHAVCLGNSVYIRSGRGKTHPHIGIVHKNEKMLALPAVDGWCEVAAVIKGQIVRGYISAKYVGRKEV